MSGGTHLLGKHLRQAALQWEVLYAFYSVIFLISEQVNLVSTMNVSLNKF